MRQRNQNVKITLMVGHKHLRFALQYIFTANDLNPCAAEDQQDPGPDPGHFMNIIFRVIKKRKDDRPE